MSPSHDAAPRRPLQGALLLLASSCDPSALLAHRLVEILHERLSGLCEALADREHGFRSAAYLRGMFRAEHPTTTRDLAVLACHPSREARDAARAIGLALVAATEPRGGEAIETAAAGYTDEAADVRSKS
jgi:hypothetical protein